MFLQPQLFALDGGSEIATNAVKTTEAIVRGWETVWQQTIVNPPVNGSYWQVCWVATWVMIVGGLVFLFNRATRIFENGHLSSAHFSQAITYFLVPGMIWMGLVNHGAMAANLSYSMNRVILFSNEKIMQTQIASTSFEESVKAMQLTSLAQNELRQKYQDCMDLKDQPPPAGTDGKTVPLDDVLANNRQFQCFQALNDQMAKLRDAFATRNCYGLYAITCNGVFRIFQEAASAIGQGLEDAANQIGDDLKNKSTAGVAGYFFTTDVPLIIGGAVARNVGDYMAGGALHAWLKPLLYAFQFDYMNTLIGGLFLCGMSGPIAFAASLFPFTPRTIWTWAIAFFSFGMAIFLYSVLIGTVASLLVSAQAETFTAMQYALFLGLFAPAISSTLALGGAWVAARAAQSNSHSVGTFGFSMVSSFLTTAMQLLPVILGL